MSVKRIAMWSGPRNLSTALMRSFASRLDCCVIDEPFYAAYLKETRTSHPMKRKILKLYNSNPYEVAEDCVSRKVTEKVQYQKHMAHHMLDTFDCSFVHLLSNAFLIRSPEKVIKSFGKKIINFGLKDLGYIQQSQLFEMVCDKKGVPPPVIDADDLCTNPAGALFKLCSSLGINYSSKMLAWSTGPHSYDGIWGDYWYRSVNETTGFGLPKTQVVKLSGFEEKLCYEAKPYFNKLDNYKIIV